MICRCLCDIQAFHRNVYCSQQKYYLIKDRESYMDQHPFGVKVSIYNFDSLF